MGGKRDWWSRAFLAVAAGSPLAIERLLDDWKVSLGAATGVTLLTWYGTFLASEAPGGADIIQRYRYVFGNTVDPFRQVLRKADPTARVNVMLAKRDWRLTKRFVFFDREDLNGHPDENLDLKASQGVAGKALISKRWAIGDLESRTLYLGAIGSDQHSNAENHVSYGLTTEQQQATCGLTAVLSFPIRRLEQVRDRKMEFSDDVIGVVNIDSKMTGAMASYEASGLKKELLLNRMPTLACICAAFFS